MNSTKNINNKCILCNIVLNYTHYNLIICDDTAKPFDTDDPNYFKRPICDECREGLFQRGLKHPSLSNIEIITHAQETKGKGFEVGEMSDGFHTFNELYEHRHALFGLLCKRDNASWKSKKHYDGTELPGWFVAGIYVGEQLDKQITYHLPNKLWDSFPAKELERAPKWDGHTPEDVVDRLKESWK